ncbi:MAG: hypothetical protein JNK82_09645, partial [Myxococcaceae bacterium]|nr:hypothetical protein [Myxococcaceae bacterium]
MSSAAAVLAPSSSSSSSTLRRVGAVLAGLVATFVVTSAVDAVMHATGVYPPVDAPPMSDALFAVAFGYRLVFNAGGAWLTARLAPDRGLAHALVLGAVGTVFGVIGTLMFWDAGPH